MRDAEVLLRRAVVLLREWEANLGDGTDEQERVSEFLNDEEASR